MSDLISRSALINKIRGIVPGSQDVDFIVGLIENQPTSFDTEQVIHNLECEKTIWVGRNITTTDVMKIDDAIDIVKKGGVE